MAFLFGKKKTPAEMMREYKRQIDRGVRDLDRERSKLESQEKKIVMDIKKAVKAGQMSSVKIMAKDLVRTRRYVSKFYGMRTQLQAVGLKLQTMKSTQTMVEAMRGCTRAMMMMNRQIDLPAMRNIMMEFEKQSDMMDQREEMMNDTLDDVMGEEGDEEESEEIVNKVLEELNITMQHDMPLATSTPPVAEPQAQASASNEDQLDADLAARLNNLRNG